MTERPLAVVIMAAGKGTRMKDPERAKVMFELDGKPMIHFVVDVAYEVRAARVLVIVGYQREAVTQYVQASHPQAEAVVQEQQLGTGHAVLQAREALKDFGGDVLVLSGDVPLLRAATLEDLVRHHRAAGAAGTILTADVERPFGYGRIIRKPDGTVLRIVEEKDATAEERSVREINSGIYVFDRRRLFDALEHISPHNVQREYYLTDVFGWFSDSGLTIAALKASDEREIRGINTVEQLEEARMLLKRR